MQTLPGAIEKYLEIERRLKVKSIDAATIWETLLRIRDERGIYAEYDVTIIHAGRKDYCDSNRYRGLAGWSV